MSATFKSSVAWFEAYIEWFEFCAICSKRFNFDFALDCLVCFITVLMLRNIMKLVVRVFLIN